MEILKFKVGHTSPDPPQRVVNNERCGVAVEWCLSVYVVPIRYVGAIGLCGAPGGTAAIKRLAPLGDLGGDARTLQ